MIAIYRILCKLNRRNTVFAYLKYWYQCTKCFPSVLGTGTFAKTRWYWEPINHYFIRFNLCYIIWSLVIVVGAKQSSNNGAANKSTDTKTHCQFRPACQDSCRGNQDSGQDPTANLPLTFPWHTHTRHFTSLAPPVSYTITTPTSSQLACLSHSLTLVMYLHVVLFV